MAVFCPSHQAFDGPHQHPAQPPLVHRDVGTIEHEMLVDELQHVHLVPGQLIEGDQSDPRIVRRSQHHRLP